MSELKKEIKDILEKSIKFEEESRLFYEKAEKLVENSSIKKLLKDFAAEEIKHKEKLQDIIDNGVNEMIIGNDAEKVEDLQITDNLLPAEINDNSSYQEILIIAGKREKSSYDFYKFMAGIVKNPQISKLFNYLSAEELRHKNYIEKLYDENVLEEM